MRKAIAILPVVSAIYPMITGSTAPPTIVMMSREKVSLAFVPASLNARMELATNLFMIKELFLIDFNSSTHYTYCRYLNNKYKHEKEKTLDCYKRKSNSLYQKAN